MNIKLRRGMNAGYPGFTPVEILLAVVIAGWLGSMAIPAFQKVGTISQATAVPTGARQLSARSSPYYPEKGPLIAAPIYLPGPAPRVWALHPVANETHPSGFPQGITKAFPEPESSPAPWDRVGSARRADFLYSCSKISYKTTRRGGYGCYYVFTIVLS